MKGLLALSWRNLRRRQARYALILVGTALGVATVLAVIVTATDNSRSLARDLEGSLGNAQAFVKALGAYDATMPASTEARVAAIPGVAAVSPGFGFQSAILPPIGTPSKATVASNLPDAAFLNVEGIDLARATTMQQFPLIAGRMFRPGVAELVVPKAYVKNWPGIRGSVGIGKSVELQTPTGPRPVRVVGILADTDAGLANGGATGYTSLAEAQDLAGRAGSLTGIDVGLTSGTDRAAWISSARKILGSGLGVVDANDAAGGFKSFLAAIDGAFVLISAIALFIGSFLIFLTFSVAVAERVPIYGTLRALGARPSQIRRMVVAESAGLGLVASLLGLVLGYGLAELSVRLSGHLLHIATAPIGVPWMAAGVALALGIGVSAVAAWLPARRASSISPVVAMRPRMASSPQRPRWVPGLVLLLAGGGMASPPAPALLRDVSGPVVLLGAVLLVPTVLKPLAYLLGRLTRRFAPGVGDVAVMHLVKERSRSSYTLGLIMVVLAMLLAIGASNQAMNRTLGQVLDRQLGSASDLQIGAPQSFDPAVGKRLQALPDVAAVTPVWFGGTEIVRPGASNPTELPLEIVDPSSFFSVSGLVWAKGSDPIAKQALASGEVLLPEVTAANLGLSVGETVHVRTTAGLSDLKLAATYSSMGTGAGLVAGTSDLALLGSGRPNMYLVRATSADAIGTVRAEVFGAIGAQYHPYVQTAAAVRQVAGSQIGGFFGIAYALLAVAALIGMLGLGNTLVVSVLSRIREIGVLRALGVRRRQLRRMVLVEAETLALVAFALAVPLAAIIGYVSVVGQRNSLGFSISFRFPWNLLLPVLVVAMVMAALASLLPARRSAALQPTEALRFE